MQYNKALITQKKKLFIYKSIIVIPSIEEKRKMKSKNPNVSHGCYAL